MNFAVFFAKIKRFLKFILFKISKLLSLALSLVVKINLVRLRPFFLGLVLIFCVSNFWSPVLAALPNYNDLISKIEGELEQKARAIKIAKETLQDLEQQRTDADIFFNRDYSANKAKLNGEIEKFTAELTALSSLSTTNPAVIAAKKADLDKADKDLVDLEAKKKQVENDLKSINDGIKQQGTNLASLESEKGDLDYNLADTQRQAAAEAAWISDELEMGIEELPEKDQGDLTAVNRYIDKAKSGLRECRDKQDKIYKLIDCEPYVEAARVAWAKYVVAKIAEETKSKVKVSEILQVEGQESFQDAESFLGKLIDLLVKLISLVAFILLIIAGFRMVLAAGNDNEIQKAKALFTHTLIGLVIALLAYLIIVFVRFLLGVS